MSLGVISESEISDKFAQIVGDSLHLDPQTVKPQVFLHDIGAESLDMIEIAMEVESQFNIWLPEKTLLQTASDVFGTGVLEKDHMLTETGKELLARRMPPEDAALFVSGHTVSIKDVNRYFLKVSTWISMIHGLLQFTPRECATCGGPMTASLGFRMKCSACGAEVTLRSGDEINREWAQAMYKGPYSHLAAARVASPVGTESVGVTA